MVLAPIERREAVGVLEDQLLQTLEVLRFVSKEIAYLADRELSRPSRC